MTDADGLVWRPLPEAVTRRGKSTKARPELSSADTGLAPACGLNPLDLG